MGRSSSSSSSSSSNSSSSEDDKPKKKPMNDRALRYRGNRAADARALRLAVERFVVGYRLDDHAARKLRSLKPSAKRAVLAEGPLDGRSIIAVLVSRIKRLPPQSVMDRNYRTPPPSPSREEDAVAYEEDKEARQRLVQAKVREYLQHYSLTGSDVPIGASEDDSVASLSSSSSSSSPDGGRDRRRPRRRRHRSSKKRSRRRSESDSDDDSSPERSSRDRRRRPRKKHRSSSKKPKKKKRHRSKRSRDDSESSDSN